MLKHKFPMDTTADCHPSSIGDEELVVAVDDVENQRGRTKCLRSAGICCRWSDDV